MEQSCARKCNGMQQWPSFHPAWAAATCCSISAIRRWCSCCSAWRAARSCWSCSSSLTNCCCGINLFSWISVGSFIVWSCLHLSQVRRAALLSCCFLPAVAMGVMPDLICKSCPGLRMPSCIFACPDQIQKDSATKTQLFLPCKCSIIRWKAPLQLLYVLARLAELQRALPACELQRIVKWSSQNHVNCKPS